MSEKNIMYKHQITTDDKWLLDKHPIDPVTHEAFKVGDMIVICADCKTVHFDTTWFINQRKPCAVCNGTTLIDFNLLLSEAFRRNDSDILKIRNSNARIENLDQSVKQILFKPKQKTRKKARDIGQMLSSYVFVVLDFSALFSFLEVEFFENLKNHADVFVAKTFNIECKQIQIFLSGNSLATFQKNKRLIKGITTKLLPNGTKVSDFDVFSLTKYFADNDVDVILIVSNQILIQKIVLEDIHVDIYDVSNNKLLRFNQFISYKSNFEISYNKNILPYKTSARTELYTDNGDTIFLGSEFNTSGTEAIIYRINDNSSLLAKIYRDKKLTIEKISNIKKLAQLDFISRIEWGTFPKNILYLDRTLTQPIGYTMILAKNIKLLSDEELYAGRVEDILLNNRETKISHTVELCLKIVRQIIFLNMNGIVVSDFNDGNFAFPIDKKQPIMMLDTDSFGNKEYFSDCRAQYDEYTRVYDFSKKNEAINFSYESLFIFAFKLFSLGLEPLYDNKFRFRKDRNNYGNDFRWEFFPHNLKIFFITIFDEKKVRSINAFLYELENANRALKKTKTNNKTYRELCTELLDSTRADIIETKFTGVLRHISHKKLFAENDTIGVKEQYNEIIYFKLNEDKTYTVALKNDESFLFLSVSKEIGRNETRLSFRVSELTYAQKWRIEQINKRFIDDCEVIDCIIGSELFPRLALSINDKNDLYLDERSENNGRQHFCIYKISESDYYNKLNNHPDKIKKVLKQHEDEKARKECEYKVNEQIEKKKKRYKIVLGIIATAIILILAIILIVFLRNKDGDDLTNELLPQQNQITTEEIIYE